MPFSHPAIKELIFRFAFNSAGKADPLVYARQDWLNPIPKKTIALATLAVSPETTTTCYMLTLGAQLHNSLNEFATGRHVEVAFDEKTYSSAYVDMVAQLRRLSQSQNKRDMLADWQRNVYAEGMYVFCWMSSLLTNRNSIHPQGEVRFSPELQRICCNLRTLVGYRTRRA